MKPLLLLLPLGAVLALEFPDESSESDEHNDGQTSQPNPPTDVQSDNPNRPKCPQHWFTSYRPQGVWCIRLGLTTMEYQGAKAECGTYGGVLTGIQNSWERWLIAQEAVRQTLYYNIHIGGVWLGAQRNFNNESFYWTDGHTTGTEGIKWGPGQPDNDRTNGPENCLQLIALSPGYWNNPGKYSGFRTGDIEDYWCHKKEPATRLFACGMKGPPEN
uniref:C-type lectin domain-containing protein n=1 Tax=Caenorhabditis japonica TaxID=281687 RepID=A0A8R1E009_CAEJA